MSIRYLIAAAFAAGALTAPLHAQGTPEKKPGGLDKAAHDVSATMKKAGKDTKAEAKRDASKTHAALTKAGKDTKAEAKRATHQKPKAKKSKAKSKPKDPTAKP